MGNTRISISLDKRSLDRIRKLEQQDKTKLYREVVRLFSRQGILGAGFITKEYLSGQRLNRITGTLSRSVVGQGGLLRGVPTLRIGVLTGPALAYAAILELGTSDFNPDSPFSFDKNGRPLKGRRPRNYLRDGFERTLDKMRPQLEDLLVNFLKGIDNA